MRGPRPRARAALRRHPGAPDRARRQLPGDRPIARVSVRRVPAAGADRAAASSCPTACSPAQVRGALTAVIRRTLEAPGTFDANGWLTIGFAGHQPASASATSRRGASISARWLPAARPGADHAFWNGPDIQTTGMRAWNGQEFSIRQRDLELNEGRRQSHVRRPSWAPYEQEFEMSFTDLTLSFVSAVAPAAVAAVGAAAESALSDALVISTLSLASC